jgi:hypothetical protein
MSLVCTCEVFATFACKLAKLALKKLTWIATLPPVSRLWIWFEVYFSQCTGANAAFLTRRT